MRIKILTLLFISLGLSGCSVVPGMHQGTSDESSVDMPVVKNNKAVMKKLNIKEITAQVVIDIEKNFNNRSLGPDNVANHYFNYRIGSNTIKGVPEKKRQTQYLVGPRDVLTITVWDHPELTIPAGEFRSATSSGNGNIVGEDGNIFFPYAGVIKAAGRTVEEIRAELTRKLAKYIERVQLDVRVADYRSQRVFVVGEVKVPGVQLVKDIPLTVLEAINQAGGVTKESDRRNITLTRDDKTYSINLLALYEGGDTSQNVLLQSGDVLNVPDREFNKVFVLGDTAGSGTGSARSRSVYMNKGRMTLTEAISEGGGADQEESDPARIFVFRNGLGKSEIFLLDAKSPDALLLADRFPLHPRDVVYINRAEGRRWNQIIQQVKPTVDLLNVFDSSPSFNPIVK
ncbi:MAG: polysaccharide biosynthesis/export family protein [Methylococcales bacterium]|nr:polysaccharide biosynthesis/export family protein [Methylococcales bacterium]